MLRYVSEILSGTFLVIAPIFFGKNVLNEKIKVNKKKLVIFTLIMIFSYIIIYKISTEVLKTMLGFIIYMIIFKYLYKLNYKKSIFITFIYAIIMVVIELLIIFTITIIFRIPKELFYNNLAGSLLGNFISNAIVVIISLILNEKLRKIIDAEIENTIKIVILSVLTFICIIYFFYKFSNRFQINQEFISSLIIMIFFFVSLIMVIRQTLENNKLKFEYDKLLDFMKTYEVEIEKQRIQHHENKNQLLTIKSKIIDQENKQNIIKYIDSLLDENITINQAYYAKFQYLPSNGLKALFYFKASEAENKGINITISISPKIKNSLLNNLSPNNFKQLGRIVGVYLDNAIEASTISKSKSMGIEVYKEKDDVKIIITNSFDGEIDPDVGNEIFSTKGKKRGHGLMLVKNIINSNNMFVQRREIRQNVYVQILTIKHKK